MDLDKLEEETNKLLAILRNKQPGLFTWNMMFTEQIQTIVNMASKAGIKACDHEIQ